jgi:hypothetical protein
VRSRVTNIIEHIPEGKLKEICGDIADPDERTARVVAAMFNAMIKAAAREYDCRTVMQEGGSAANGVITACDMPQIPQEIIDRYSSEEWRLGTRIPFSKEIEHRFEWGGVRIEMEMRGEYIADIRIYSDALETEIFGVLEELIRGCRYDAGEILGLRLPHGVAASAYEILEMIAASIE